jgi:hypothetical protein
VNLGFNRGTTNVCEHCANYRSEPAMLAVLSARHADAQQLAQAAEQRGWTTKPLVTSR